MKHVELPRELVTDVAAQPCATIISRVYSNMTISIYVCINGWKYRNSFPIHGMVETSFYRTRIVCWRRKKIVYRFTWNYQSFSLNILYTIFIAHRFSVDPVQSCILWSREAQVKHASVNVDGIRCRSNIHLKVALRWEDYSAYRVKSRNSFCIFNHCVFGRHHEDDMLSSLPNVGRIDTFLWQISFPAINAQTSENCVYEVSAGVTMA